MSFLTPAHKKASAFVDAFQNPFGKRLGEIAQPIWDANTAGTLTYEQAKDALDTFNREWTGFDEAAQQFRGMGGAYKKVVDQAYDPTKAFMGTVASVRTSLESLTAGLKPSGTETKDDTETKPPTTDTLLAPGETKEGEARKAALQTKKRAMAAPGFISTILAGATQTAATPRKTLLGY